MNSYRVVDKTAAASYKDYPGYKQFFIINGNDNVIHSTYNTLKEALNVAFELNLKEQMQ